MKLYEKVKIIRENKKTPQSYLSHELGFSQSQYSRREKGEIKFIPDEIRKLAKILETTVANLFEEDAIILNPINPKKEDSRQYITVTKKLIEQYEFRLKEKDEMIAFLRQGK